MSKKNNKPIIIGKRELTEQANLVQNNPGLDITESEFENLIDTLCMNFLLGTPWEATLIKDPKSRRHQMGLYAVPLLCKANNCPYAVVCPVLKELPADRWDKLINTRCRVETVLATRYFSEQVINLAIKPTDTSDLINVVDIVRYLLIKHRLDNELAIFGMTQELVDAVDPKHGDILSTKSEVSGVLAEMERVTKNIIKLQNTLLATRKDRLDVAKTANDSHLLAKQLEQVLKKRKEREKELADSIDAEIVDD